MSTTENKIVYFASDLHLGVPNHAESLVREQRFIRWLDFIKTDADELYLLGDVFDMWFEYKHVVPKGYVRLLGKLAELADAGIVIHYFTGNHDMWTKEYFTQEIGIVMHRKPEIQSINGLNFYIAHGDGLGHGDFSYKMVQWVFESRSCRWLFARVHPDLGLGLAHFFSRKSRIANGNYDEIFYGNDREQLVQHCEQLVKKFKLDFCVFGHRHLPLEIALSSGATYFNTGEWVKSFSYLKVESKKVELLYFNS